MQPRKSLQFVSFFFRFYDLLCYGLTLYRIAVCTLSNSTAKCLYAAVTLLPTIKAKTARHEVEAVFYMMYLPETLSGIALQIQYLNLNTSCHKNK